MTAEFTSPEGHESIRISFLLYLGFVVNPLVNIHVVIFWVKALFSQLGGEDGGCMFFLNFGARVLDEAAV